MVAAVVTPSLLESVTKAVAVAAAASYVVGLLVTNLYLRFFGFADFSILRTRYILTGAIAIAVLIFIGGSLNVFGRMLARVIPHYWRSLRHHSYPIPNTARALVGRIGHMLHLMVLPIAVIFMIVGYDIGLSTHSVLGFLLVTAYATIAFNYVLYMALNSRISPFESARVPKVLIPMRRDEGKDFDSLNRDLDWFTWITLPIVTFATLMMFLASYSAVLYPALPDELGGGKERSVRLVLFQEYLPEARALGLNVSEDQLITPEYGLIWESDTHYLIKISPQDLPAQALQVGKSLTAGITVQPVEPSGAFGLARSNYPSRSTATPIPTATPSVPEAEERE